MQSAGFRYGTSASSLNSDISAAFSEGGISATLGGLDAGTVYYYQAYAVVCGTGDKASVSKTFSGDVKSFTTVASSSSGTVLPAVDKDWLELPAGMDEGDNSRYVVNTTWSGELRNYTHLYDTQTMTSLWTAYPLSGSYMGDLARPTSWSYNPAIPAGYQADLRSYSYTDETYSRGHMCPNASRNGDDTMQKQTFYVTNQVPQIQNKFNSGIWSSLEEAVQTVSKSGEVFVVTGVAFNKPGESKTVDYVSPKSNSSQNCPIPNYFYKIVLKVKYSGTDVTDACAVGFWFEHAAYTDSYTNYTVPVDSIEQWTGFDFFVNLPDSVEEAAESKATTWDEFQAW